VRGGKEPVGTGEADAAFDSAMDEAADSNEAEEL
jgi:hypothetical protein